MAYQYPNTPAEKLTDLEIFIDVFVTQMKIETKVREMLPAIKDDKLSEKYGWRYDKSFYGKKLACAFIAACWTVYFNRDRELINIEGDLEQAWIKYEHFERMGRPDATTSRYFREKYREYNKCIMPYYDFFKLPLEERLAKLVGNSSSKDAKVSSADSFKKFIAKYRKLSGTP